MKISWTSLKISIAGAKLSHLVQKDRIWDHGSMIEQAKLIFFKVHRTLASGKIEDLKKYLTTSCYDRLEKELTDLDSKGKTWIIKNPIINEIAVTRAHTAKNDKPDSFEALIKAIGIKLIADKKETTGSVHAHDYDANRFSETWCFVRLGEWWLLEEIKTKNKSI